MMQGSDFSPQTRPRAALAAAPSRLLASVRFARRSRLRPSALAAGCAALIAAVAAAIALAALAIQPASAHNPNSWVGVATFDPPPLALTALDAAGSAQTGTHRHYDNGASARNRVQLKITHSCVNSGHLNWLLCPVRATRYQQHFGALTFYVFNGSSGRADSDAVSGAAGYRPADGGSWSACTSGANDICVISAADHYREDGTRIGNKVEITFQISFSVPSATTGEIRVAVKHRHVHASSDTWAELSYDSAEPDLSVELKPYGSDGALESGDVSANTRNYSAGTTPNKVRIRIMASATEPLRAAHFVHFTSVRIGIFAGASGRAASDAVSGAGIKTADGANSWHGCQAGSSAHWPCTMTPSLYSVAHIENALLRSQAIVGAALFGPSSDAESGVDFSFTLPAGTTGEVRLFAQFADSSRSGSGWAELAYGDPAAATEQPTAPITEPVQPEPTEPPTAKLVPYTSAGALETGDLSANSRSYAAGTGRQRVQLSVVDSDGDPVAYSEFDSIKITVFSGASGRADSAFIIGSVAYAVGGGTWNACAGRGDHDICVINRVNYKRAAGASADSDDIAAIEFTFSVPDGTTGGIRLAAALAPSASGAAIQWTELAYSQQSSPPADPQPEPITSSPTPTPAAKITPYTAAGALETGDIATNTRSYVKGGSALNKVRLSVGPASGDDTITYAHINRVAVYVFGAGSGRDAADAVSGASVRSSTGAAWSTCEAVATGHAICEIERGAWKTAAGARSNSAAVAALDFSFKLASATTGGVRLAVALHARGGGTPSWTEVAYGAPAQVQAPTEDSAPQPDTPSPTPAAKLTPYTSAGVLEADGTTSRTYATGSTRNKVRLSVGPASGSGTITYAAIDKAAVYLFGAGSGRALGDSLATGSIWDSDGRSWSTCALPQTGFANCEISRAAWKTAAGAGADTETVGSLDFSVKLTSATTGSVRLAVALYAGGSSTPSWTEVTYDAASALSPEEPAPTESTPSPTPAAKITPYTAAGALETGDISTNTRSYAKGASTLNKIRLSIGPASGSGTITYADIDKVAVHVFGAGSGRDASDAVSGASVRSSAGAAWSTCAAAATGHAICEISRAAWKTAASATADTETVGALDFGFRLTSATSGAVRFAVALYAGGGTPSWTEVAYRAPLQPITIAPPQDPNARTAPDPEHPVETFPLAALTPYTAAGELETGDVDANFRRYVRGANTLNKVRLSVAPLAGSGTITYADIDMVSVHVFTAGSGRAAADAFSGAQVRSATGAAWSACSATASDHAICEISRAAWKTAAGDSSDAAAVAPLDFGFRLPAGASGIARLAARLTAKNEAVLQWVELSYSEPAATGPGGPGGPGDSDNPGGSDNPEEPENPEDPAVPPDPVVEEPEHPTGPVCIGTCEEDSGGDSVRVVSARLVRADGRSGSVPVESDVPLRLVLRGQDGEYVPIRAVAKIKLVILTGGGTASHRGCPPGVTCLPAPPSPRVVRSASDGPIVMRSISGDAPLQPLPINFRAPGEPGQTEVCAVIVNAEGGKPLLAEVLISYGNPVAARAVAAPSSTWIALEDKVKYLHRHATRSGRRDSASFTARAYDQDSRRVPFPEPSEGAIYGPGGKRVAADRISLAERCAAGRASCTYHVRVLADADDPLAMGRYQLHVSADGKMARADFYIAGPAAEVIVVSAQPRGFQLPFEFRVRVLDEYGNPVADGTPVWWDATTRAPEHGPTTAAAIAITSLLEEFTPTIDGEASAEVLVLGEEIGILRAWAGGIAEAPDAAVLEVVDTAFPHDCSVSWLSEVRPEQGLSYVTYDGQPGCRASSLLDTLAGNWQSVKLWNGRRWIRYAESGGQVIPGSVDFAIAVGDNLSLIPA